MHSYIFDYDTQFSKGCCWIRVKADSKEKAIKLFWEIVPACTEIRKISMEY